jgi:predicted amidohydrolase
MQRAVDLINSNQLEAALVRLWVKAGIYEGGGSFLNRWERERDARTHERLVGEFREQIERGRAIALDAAERAPLALITALDSSLAVLTTAQPFVTQAHEEQGERFWLVRIAAAARRGDLPLRRQANNREAWFRRHAVIPARTAGGIEVSVKPAHGIAAHALERLVEAGENLRFWIGHFEDQAETTGHVRLEWRTSAARKALFTGMINARARLESIRNAWQSAKDAAVHVFILPELTVTLEHRSAVRGWLQNGDGHPFTLVLAGSFHEMEKDGGNRYNTAELWDCKGERLLHHRKLRPYGEADGLAEDISDGNCIEVLITAIGALAIPICKDFLDDYPKVATLFEEVPVEWILVPSYGNEATLTLHQDRARKLAHFGPGTTSVVANQRNIEVGEGEPCPGFAFPATADQPLPVAGAGGSISLPALSA